MVNFFSAYFVVIFVAIATVKLKLTPDFYTLAILFDFFIIYVPSTVFQLNRDGSFWVEPVLSLDKCVLLKDHNAVTRVRLEPVAPPSRVKHSTTEPLRSLHLGYRSHILLRRNG